MIRYIIFALAYSLSISTFATAQESDYLLFKGEKHLLHSNPLEELFFKDEALRPTRHVVSSANWRGYIATFAIRRGALWVDDITISKPKPDEEHSYLRESVVTKTFPRKVDRTMQWFSGLLIAPLGDPVKYVHLSYASQYENYLLIRIENGLLQESAKMSLREYKHFKVRQFKVFKQSPEYQQQYKELSEQSKDSDSFDIEGFIFTMGSFTHKVVIPFKEPKAT